MLPAAITEPIVGLATLIGAILVIWRFVVPAIQRARERAARRERANDVLLGTPAIPDPDRPGEYLRPAVPDMGVRMTAVESTLGALALQDLHARLDRQGSETEQARRAADHAARDARLALKAATDLRAASEVWHANEIGVLNDIESRITPARRSTDTEADG